MQNGNVKPQSQAEQQQEIKLNFHTYVTAIGFFKTVQHISCMSKLMNKVKKYLHCISTHYMRAEIMLHKAFYSSETNENSEKN